MTKSRLFTIFVIVFIDLMGFGLILPLLPFYAESFGASPFVQGILVASYAFGQLIGAPILGRLSDRYGRRPILLLSIFGTFLSLLLLGFANTLIVLFISRILDGITGGNISVAQAYITDVTDEENRAKGLGMIGAAFGFGFILGPAIGGLLSAIGTSTIAPMVAESGNAFLQNINWTYALPAFAAATVSFLNVLQVYFTLPESLTAERRVEIQAKNNVNVPHRRVFSFSLLRDTLSREFVGSLLTVLFFYGIAFTMFQTVFPIYANQQLGLSEAQTGFVLAYVGILVALVQGLAIGRITARFPEDRLLFYSCILMAISLLGWALTPNVWILLIVLAPVALAGGVFGTVLNSSLTKAVDRDEVGGILGISASVESSTRVISPIIGGTLIGSLGGWAPGAMGAILVSAMAYYAWVKIVDKEKPKKQYSEEIEFVPK